MSNIAIEFQNVGKMYRLGRVGTGTLSHDLNRWWQMSVLGKEDPYLKIGQSNDRSFKGDSDYVWALRDISFKVEQGEVLGIIGKNGAGKSTLLKLLSNITSPSTGSIKYQGRIASLLEVGTGFHPEMTGRENIYMNGSIMGMTKREIARKLDEIVDFAGVGRYLDTPVKRYSSGMTVRLGFAVAAFLEPEILVVDEVLAVGDAEFQKRAVGKMEEVAHSKGRTVLFVSHNMSSVRSLCRLGLVLDDGKIAYGGSIDKAIEFYASSISFEKAARVLKDGITWKSPFITINEIKLNGSPSSHCYINFNQISLELEINGQTRELLPSLDVRMEIRNREGIILATFAEGHYRGKVQEVKPGCFEIRKQILLPKYMSHGDYLIHIFLHQPECCHYMKAPFCGVLHVEGGADVFCQTLDFNRDGLMGLESIEP